MGRVMDRCVALLAAVAAAIAQALLATPAAAAPTLTLPVEEHRLASGVRVVLAPDPALDDVAVLVRYAAGSADDPPGKEGLAHFVEHIMFGGSEHTAGGFWRWLGQAGAWNVNATTSLDETRYFATVPPERLELLFWLESDRMGFLLPRLEEATLRREHAIVADEMRGSVVDRLFGKAGEELRSGVFPDWHPYHRVADLGTIEGLSLADVRAFLRTWYSPRNATVFVAGRFDPASALALAARYFGDLPGGEPPARPPLPEWRAANVRIDVGARSLRDEVAVAWPAPALHERGDAALDVAALILADPRGRLQRALVERGLAVHVSAHEDSHRRASVFVVGATVADGASSDAALDAIDEQVRALGRDVRPDECDRARNELIDVELLRLQTSSGRVQRLATAASMASPFDLGWYDRITPADVETAVRTVLVDDHRVVTVVRHDPRYPAHGVVLGRREVVSKEQAP
jgi:zinc protease